MGNTIDPSYVPSEAEQRRLQDKTNAMLQRMAAKRAASQQQVAGNTTESPLNGVALLTDSSGYHYLPVEVAWHEPDDGAHVNHCGPGATQVALDVRLPSWQVPDIDTLGNEEYTNQGKVGTFVNDITTVLNNRLGQLWYGTYYGSDVYWHLQEYLLDDLDNGYAPVTGLMTRDMPGWGGRDVAHIVAVTGYYYSGGGTKYQETASWMAGYGGGFDQYVNYSDFYNWVNRNPAISW